MFLQTEIRKYNYVKRLPFFSKKKYSLIELLQVFKNESYIFACIFVINSTSLYLVILSILKIPNA